MATESKKTKTASKTTKTESKNVLKRNTSPKRNALANNALAMDYLSNGGTCQVLARACLQATEGNVTNAALAFAHACGMTDVEGKLDLHEARKYVTWASKQDRLDGHNTITSAVTVASKAVKAVAQ